MTNTAGIDGIPPPCTTDEHFINIPLCYSTDRVAMTCHNKALNEAYTKGMEELNIPI
jgi:hypothetical protein